MSETSVLTKAPLPQAWPAGQKPTDIDQKIGENLQKLVERTNLAVEQFGTTVDAAAEYLESSVNQFQDKLTTRERRKEVLNRTIDAAFLPYKGVRWLTNLGFGAAARGIQAVGEKANVEDAWIASGARRVALEIEDKILGEAIGKGAVRELAEFFKDGVTPEKIEAAKSGKIEGSVPGDLVPLFIANALKNAGEGDIWRCIEIFEKDREFKSEDTLKLAEHFGALPPSLALQAIKQGLMIGAMGKIMGIFGMAFGKYYSVARTAEIFSSEENRVKFINQFKEIQKEMGTRNALIAVGAGALLPAVNEALKASVIGNVLIAAAGRVVEGGETKTTVAKWTKAVCAGTALGYLGMTAKSFTDATVSLGELGIKTAVAHGEKVVEADLRMLREIGQDAVEGVDVVIDNGGDISYKLGELFRVSHGEVSKVKEDGTLVGDKVKVNTKTFELETEGGQAKVRVEYERGPAHKLARYVDSGGGERLVPTDDKLDDRAQAITEIIKNLKSDDADFPNQVYSIPKDDLIKFQDFLQSHDLDFSSVDWTSDNAQSRAAEVIHNADTNDVVSSHDEHQWAYLLTTINDNTQPTYEALYNLADQQALLASGVEIPEPEDYHNFVLGIEAPPPDTNVEDLSVKRGYAIGELAEGVKENGLTAGAAGYTKEQLGNLGDYAEEIKQLDWKVGAAGVENQLEALAVPERIGMDNEITGDEMTRSDLARMIEILHDNPHSYYYVADKVEGATLPDLETYTEHGWVGEMEEELLEEEIETGDTSPPAEEEATPPSEEERGEAISITQVGGPNQQPTETPVPTTTEVPPTQAPPVTPDLSVTPTPGRQDAELPGDQSVGPQIRVPEWVAPAVGGGLGVVALGGLAYKNRDVIGKVGKQIPAFLRRLAKRHQATPPPVVKPVTPPSSSQSSITQVGAINQTVQVSRQPQERRPYFSVESILDSVKQRRVLTKLEVEFLREEFERLKELRLSRKDLREEERKWLEDYSPSGPNYHPRFLLRYFMVLRKEAFDG